MDSKLVLIKIITLLYCESKCSRIVNRSVDLAVDIIGRLKLPEQVTETDNGRDVIVGLRETALWMAEQPKDEPFDYGGLAQRIRLNAGDDFVVYQAWEEVEKYAELDDDQLLKVCASIEGELKGFLHQWAVREIIHKAHREMFYTSKPLDWRKYVENLVSDLETYRDGISKEQESFVLNLMNMSDPTTLASVLEKAKEENEGSGGFTTGHHAMNRMFGESQQLRRGMFVLVGGLTHNYKSGLVHDFFRHFCIYNTPVLMDPKKKPINLYFSTENRAEEDLLRMYIALKENETGVAVDISQVDRVQASEYIARRLTERGFEAAMLRLDPNDFTYNDLFNTVLKYESNGYEVQSICFDYLALINKKGCHSNMIGEDTRMLMQKVRTFMSARNILFVTPHQLSQEAMGLKRSGVENFVAEVAGKNYWDGSKRIANEADLEIFVDIVERNKKSYLAVHRGKHRTVKATPVKYRHFYLPFQEVAYIPDDINGEDTSLDNLNRAENSNTIDFD